MVPKRVPPDNKRVVQMHFHIFLVFRVVTDLEYGSVTTLLVPEGGGGTD